MNTDIMKTKLEEEKQLLETELSSMGIFNSETSEWEVVPQAETSGPESDDNDLADRERDFEERTAKTAELSKQYASVTGALARIADGTYGICRVCQSPIEPERLEANPAADTCIEHREIK